MPGIERPLRDDVNNGAVYDISVLIDHNVALQLPPIRIRVFATRLYPDAQRPSSVPSGNPYLVDNT